jgi:hypothetical protein
MTEADLLDCVDWVALGYEVVQSIFPGWKFAATDTVAANALHGALLVGKRHAIAPRKAAWQRELAGFSVELHCDGKLSQTGGGALVLDSPLLAPRHLVELLAAIACRRDHLDRNVDPRDAGQRGPDLDRACARYSARGHHPSVRSLTIRAANSPAKNHRSSARASLPP